MSMPRRRAARTLAALALSIACASLHAQSFPSRPVKLVVPYAAGQGTDVAARYIAEQLAKSLGQGVVVENRPGAGGNIGTQQVAHAPADGYTLLMGTNATHAAAAFLYQNPGFDAQADFEPIAMTGVLPLAFAAAAGNPVDSVPKLIAAARAKPDQVNVAWSTTTSRAVLELFKQRAQAPLYGVGYKGSAQAVSDVIGGQIEFMADTVASIRTQVSSGKLKAIAVTSLAESETLPGVKSVAEQGVPGFEIVGWNVIFAPKGTPPEAVQVLARATMAIMSQPETRQKLLQLGTDPRALSGPELAAFLKGEREKWGQVIRSANIKIE